MSHRPARWDSTQVASDHRSAEGPVSPAKAVPLRLVTMAVVGLGKRTFRTWWTRREPLSCAANASAILVRISALSGRRKPGRIAVASSA